MKSYEKIRQLREKNKWSQEYMATQLGLSANGYAKIERGETRLTNHSTTGTNCRYFSVGCI